MLLHVAWSDWKDEDVESLMIQLEAKNQLVQLGKRDEEINVEVVNDIDF